MSAKAKKRCELLYGYLHCTGRTQYHGGYAADEAAADRWVRKQVRTGGGRKHVPEDDPVRWCPVRHCHMKRQKPWFGFRTGDGNLIVRPQGDG